LVPHSAKILGLTNEQQNTAEANFKDLGPIPRMCIDFANDPDLLFHYENYCKTMITDFTSQRLRHFVLAGAALNLDAESHDVFILRPFEVDDLRRAYIEPISANVEMQLMSTINKLQRLEKIDLYRAFVSIDATKVVAGLVYVSLVHTRLQEGIGLTLRPMIKQQPRKLSHWKCQGEEWASDSMDQDDLVTFPANTPIIYEEGELRSVEPNHLHVPKARNQVAFDSFVKLDTFLYIFQITVAKKHDIKSGIDDSLSKLQTILPPKANWRLIFIIPPGCEVDVKAGSEVEEFLEGVTLYSAHLEIEPRIFPSRLSTIWEKLIAIFH
jgi:hypothetical protein